MAWKKELTLRKIIKFMKKKRKVEHLSRNQIMIKSIFLSGWMDVKAILRIAYSNQKDDKQSTFCRFPIITEFDKKFLTTPLS